MIFEVFLKALSLGFSAGIAPGPLTILVITQTLQHDLKEGIKVAVAPVITDIPIILLCFSILNQFSTINFFIASVSLLGAAFLMKMAKDTWFARAPLISTSKIQPNSIRKGVLANLTNPHPYLFWLTIGVPIILSSQDRIVISSIVFVSTLFTTMVGIKVLLAFLVRRSSTALNLGYYSLALKASSVILCFYSIGFIFGALKAFKVIT